MSEKRVNIVDLSEAAVRALDYQAEEHAKEIAELKEKLEKSEAEVKHYVERIKKYQDAEDNLDLMYAIQRVDQLEDNGWSLKSAIEQARIEYDLEGGELALKVLEARGRLEKAS